MNFTIKWLLYDDRLYWATQQMTNDGQSFALPITVEKSDSKGFCSA